MKLVICPSVRDIFVFVVLFWILCRRFSNLLMFCLVSLVHVSAIFLGIQASMSLLFFFFKTYGVPVVLSYACVSDFQFNLYVMPYLFLSVS